MKNNLEQIVGNNEKILWKAKPSKKCFLLESIFNPTLPFALVWAAFDSIFIAASFSEGFSEDGGMMAFILIFMLFHLMPVWIYLGGVIFSGIKYKNTEYVITDRGIYVSGGIFTYHYEMKPFTDLSHVQIRRGIFDQWLGVGDVISSCLHTTVDTSPSRNSTKGDGLIIHDIPDYMEVFQLIKQLQTDIYADTMYPNDKRPETNHGYQTKYVNDIKQKKENNE